MIKGIESVTLSSKNSKELAKFYEEKVGIKITFEGVMGEDQNIYELKMKQGSVLYIVDDKELSEQDTHKARLIISFETDEIEAEVERLEKAGVKKVQDTYHIEQYGYVAKFEDIDGNAFQIVQVKA